MKAVWFDRTGPARYELMDGGKVGRVVVEP
jgi:hypothetical protein